MIAIALAFLLSATPQPIAGTTEAPPAAAETALKSPLRDAILKRLQDLSDSDQGIFHDDVTSIVEAYFPKGQSFAETERVLADQKLGPLRHFHGKGESTDNKIYVSHSDLVTKAFTDVYAVIDFEFEDGKQGSMSLKKVSAFLQASSI